MGEWADVEVTTNGGKPDSSRTRRASGNVIAAKAKVVVEGVWAWSAYGYASLFDREPLISSSPLITAIVDPTQISCEWGVSSLNALTPHPSTPKPAITYSPSCMAPVLHAKSRETRACNGINRYEEDAIYKNGEQRRLAPSVRCSTITRA